MKETNPQHFMKQNYQIYFKRFFSWSNYYENIDSIEETIKNVEFSKISESLKPNKGNTYVYNCYFHDMTSTYGGAIFYSQEESNILIEKCSFFRTSALVQGAIAITAGNSILAFLCGQNCFSEVNDGFCSIHNDTTRIINYVFDSSISQCKANDEYIMAFQYGHIYIKSVNCSNNEANSYSALACYPNQISEETKHGSDISYSSFSNNTANQYCLVVSNYYGISESKHEIKNCNIIENNSSKTIRSLGETNIYHCSVLNNISPYFSIPNSDSKIILSMCYTDKKDTELGSVTQNENLISDQFIHSLSFIETGKCVNHFYYCHCTENSFLQNLYLHKIIIPSPFIFLLLSNRK